MSAFQYIEAFQWVKAEAGLRLGSYKIVVPKFSLAFRPPRWRWCREATSRK
jgi:hypothetical protein